MNVCRVFAIFDVSDQNLDKKRHGQLDAHRDRVPHGIIRKFAPVPYHDGLPERLPASLIVPRIVQSVPLHLHGVVFPQAADMLRPHRLILVGVIYNGPGPREEDALEAPSIVEWTPALKKLTVFLYYCDL